MEQQFLDVELSAGEGVFVSRRGLPRRPRRRNRLRRALLWTMATIALLAIGRLRSPERPAHRFDPPPRTDEPT